jgi:trehalose/maltose hydrolase-like predicted phosphorylase
VWESAITGLDTAPWRGADLYENHISADVPRAWQQYYYATGNVTWLATAWPALNETCRFWECRFTRTDSVGVGAQAGPRCAPKDGVGNFTVHGVVCPDESSGVVNDSIYTNAAAAGTLAWCLEAADVLGVPSDALPAVWRDIVAAPYMPLVDKQCPTGPVHQEYTGYNGHTINQADVALLQYPLGLKFDADLARRDLDYWANQTDFGGMFTGDAAYSAAYLALGVRTAADAQLQEAWPHIEPHFNVFKEKADDTGTQHFITGAGGLLQSFLYGYAGLRVQRVGVLSFTSQQPVLPPLGVTRVTLRGMHLFGVAFDFMYDAKSICVRLQQQQQQQQQQPGADSTSLQVRLVPTGKTFAMPAASQPFACVELQPVEVFVRGYA